MNKIKQYVFNQIRFTVFLYLFHISQKQIINKIKKEEYFIMESNFNEAKHYINNPI